MARYCGDRDSEPLNRAGIAWLENALLSGQSVFSDRSLWQLNHVADLERYFSNNPDAGSGDFFEKLEVQLESCAPAVKQLAAEMLWLLLLSPSNIGAAKKRESVRRVWSWSGEQLPENHPWLADDVLTGVGSGGTSYNTNRWRELGYAIDVVKHALRLPLEERKEMFSDARQLSQWLARIPESERRQFRNMLLFMVHPDDDERIFSNSDRRQIVSKFSGKSKRAVGELTSVQVDEMLRTIREDKEGEFGTSELDFYLSPLKELWKDDGVRNWLFVWNPSHWPWTDLPEQIARTQAGKTALISWNCANSGVKPGDRAWLIRLGQEPKGIMATGNVVSAPHTKQHYDPTKADAGEMAPYADIEFSSIRDCYKETIVPLHELNTITLDNQHWSPQSSGIEIKPRSEALLEKLWEKRGQPGKPGQLR